MMLILVMVGVVVLIIVAILIAYGAGAFEHKDTPQNNAVTTTVTPGSG